MQKELVRARGPTASTEDEKQLQGPAKLTVEVLRMIQRRLESEIRTQGRQDMQLLRTLLSENDVEVPGSRTCFFSTIVFLHETIYRLRLLVSRICVIFMLYQIACSAESHQF